MDTIPGTAGDDNIVGTVDETTATANTFSVADSINGAGGSGDTLQISIADIGGARSYTPTQITNIEKLRVINSEGTKANDVTFDLTATSGLKTVEASSSAVSPITFNNIETAAVALGAISNAAAIAFNVKAAALTGTSDTVNLSLTSNTGGVTVNTNGTGFEAANITVSGTNTGALIGSGAAIKTATITGSGSLVIGGADLTALTLMDASTSSADVTYDATALNATLKGGSGNDNLTDGAGNDVITAGAGNDTVTGGTGNDNIDGGAGNDIVILTAATKEDSVVGGDGTDQLSISTAIAYSATTATDESINIKGFEALTTSAAITQNMLGLSANNTITSFVIGAAGETILQNAAISSVTGSTAGTVTLGLKTNGTADTLAITVGDVDANPAAARTIGVNATQYETVTINSVAADGNRVNFGVTNAGDGVTAAVDATATQLKSLTVTGSKNLTVVGSGKDTALTTINAADFSGTTLSLTGFATASTGSAMTVTATGAYSATVTTGGGADSITGGSGNDNLSGNDGNDTINGGIGNDTLAGGSGNNVLNGGSGNDSITATTGNDSVDGGDGNDTISVGDGTNTVVGGAGNDTITTGINADSVNGGDGDDTITTDQGNDTVDAGSGNDNINVGAGNDSVSAGSGNDTLTGGTGDDTLIAGDGNDIISITSLTNGDSVDGGAGNDRLTITTIASDATPTGITSIEDFRVTTLGGTATSITVDLTNVTGITGLQTTIAQNDGTSLTLKAAPSTMTALTLTDGGVGTTDTLTVAYRSGPTSLTVTPVGNVVGATSITSLNAPLTISGRTNQNLANDADVLYTGAAAQVNKFGNLTTDATTITINTQALPTPVAGAELTVGTITDNVLTSLNVSGATNADVTVGATTTTAAEFASLTLASGQNATTTFGGLTASGATAATFTLNQGNAGTLTLGADLSATAAALTVRGTMGDQVSGTLQKIIGASISSSIMSVGAGATITLPTLEVGATGTTATIGSVSITAGAGSVVSQTIGTTKAPTTIGPITADGAGRVDVTLGATGGPTTSSGASTQGAISGSAMTSPLSSFRVDGALAVAQLSIVGGAGNDSLVGGTLADVITAGAGVDTLTGGNGLDIFIFNVGDSNPVYGAADASSGQDTLTANGKDGAGNNELLRFVITSADTTWAMDHILVGTGAATGVQAVAGTATAANTKGFAATTVLVQTGTTTAAGTNNADAFDIVVNVNTGLSATEARDISQIVLTGTVGADSLTTGKQNDTINGGSGADTITAGAGADRIDVGSSTTDIDRVVQAAASSGGFTAPGTNTIATTTFDVVTSFSASDILQLGQYTSFGTAADNVASSTLGTVATTLVGLAVGANSVGFVRGTYTAAVINNGVTTTAGSFVGSATGSDLLVVYDGDATLATTALEAVVLVGVGANPVTGSGAGLLTIGNGG